MASKQDSTIQFFKKASPEQWTFLLGLYTEAVDIKAQTRTKKGGPEQFIKLDKWYQESLPKTIRSRKDPHLEYAELVDVMKWKLMRTKYKPASLDLVKTNTEKNVKTTTQRAFKRMPKLDGALQALTAGLKGIGTATASAILAAAFPDYAPYMAEECMVSTPDVEAEDYTQAEYFKYADHYLKFAQKLSEKDPKGEWNPHKVELAIWTHYMLRMNKPEALENMPGHVESNGCDEDESNQEAPQTNNANASNNANATNGTTNNSSSCGEEDDSQQSNGTLGHQDDSNSLPPHLNGTNGNGTKNGHQQPQQPVAADESNTTDNDTRSSLPDTAASQEEATAVAGDDCDSQDSQSRPEATTNTQDNTTTTGSSQEDEDDSNAATATTVAKRPADDHHQENGDDSQAANDEPQCKKAKVDNNGQAEAVVAVESQ